MPSFINFYYYNHLTEFNDHHQSIVSDNTLIQKMSLFTAIRNMMMGPCSPYIERYQKIEERKKNEKTSEAVKMINNIKITSSMKIEETEELIEKIKIDIKQIISEKGRNHYSVRAKMTTLMSKKSLLKQHSNHLDKIQMLEDAIISAINAAYMTKNLNDLNKIVKGTMDKDMTKTLDEIDDVIDKNEEFKNILKEITDRMGANQESTREGGETYDLEEELNTLLEEDRNGSDYEEGEIKLDDTRVINGKNNRRNNNNNNSIVMRKPVPIQGMKGNSPRNNRGNNNNNSNKNDTDSFLLGNAELEKDSIASMVKGNGGSNSNNNRNSTIDSPRAVTDSNNNKGEYEEDDQQQLQQQLLEDGEEENDKSQGEENQIQESEHEVSKLEEPTPATEDTRDVEPVREPKRNKEKRVALLAT